MPRGSPYEVLLQDKDVKRWYDNVARGSIITAGVYLRRLGTFCNKNKITPKALLKEKRKDIQNMLLDLVTVMEKDGKAGSYIHSNLKAIKSWLTFNDIEIKSKIKIKGALDTPTLKDERVPTQAELRNILLAADSQQRIADIFLAHAGLRPETLGDYEGKDGLKLSDIPEMEIHPRKNEVTFEKIPSVVLIRNNLSKAGHAYFTFLSQEGCQYLKEYLEQRMREGERLDRNSPVITPKGSQRKRAGKHIRTTNIGDMIRNSIRKAGFKWRPYVLRAYFDSQTLIAENNGKIAKDYRSFFMGHKGDIEARYTTNKCKLTEEMTEDMRQAFKKSSTYLETARAETKDAGELKRLFLLAAHIPEQEINEKKLAEMDYDELGKYIEQRLNTAKKISKEELDAMLAQKQRQIVAPIEQAKDLINMGCSFDANLGNGEAVFSLPFQQ